MKASARVEHADWLRGVRSLARASVDLLYADPPFNTGTAKRTPPNAKKRGTPGVREAVAASYADTWPTMGGYITWLGERLRATIPAMKPSGVIAIHCDYRACHHIRLLLDELLSPENFVNHLVWSYGLGGSSPRRFARKHDDILVYAVEGDRYYFDPPRIPATSNRMKGRLKKATDVLAIPAINNMAAERTGYPTQKPLALLDMLVRAFCPAGGLVVDPCCGSGTTLEASVRAGRRAVGFDTSPEAARLSRARVAGLS